MADDGDKTEKPTAKRLREARKEGQVPRSRELTTLCVLLAVLASFWLLSSWIGDGLIRVMHKGMTFDEAVAKDSSQALAYIWALVMLTIKALAPLAGILMLVALVAPSLIGGWNMTAKAFQPNLSKLNPIQGIKRQFGTQFLAEMAKAIAKSVLIGAVAAWFIYSRLPEMLNLAIEPDKESLIHTLRLVLLCALIMIIVFLVVVIIDVPYQIWSHQKKLKMSKYEVKKEHKDTEGDPQVKGKIRRQQQAMARARMMSAVPEADVVVTNPTHYAVAIAYKEGKMHAPRVVAKGSDNIAMRIKEVANEHGVPLLEAPPLARALYGNTELDQEIPVELYTAVAEVLAWVYQLQQYHRYGGSRPEAPTAVEVPKDMDKLV